MNRRDFFVKVKVAGAAALAVVGTPALAAAVELSGRYQDWYDGPQIPSECLHSISSKQLEWQALPCYAVGDHHVIYGDACYGATEAEAIAACPRTPDGHALIGYVTARNAEFPVYLNTMRYTPAVQGDETTADPFGDRRVMAMFD